MGPPKLMYIQACDSIAAVQQTGVYTITELEATPRLKDRGLASS